MEDQSMTHRELRRLSRAELLELLLEQSREVERLQQRIAELEDSLADRSLRLSRVGDLAQAALAVNGVMDAAQKAAQQYLDNIAAMEAATKIKCAEAEARSKVLMAQLQQELENQKKRKRNKKK